MTPPLWQLSVHAPLHRLTPFKSMSLRCHFVQGPSAESSISRHNLERGCRAIHAVEVGSVARTWCALPALRGMGIRLPCVYCLCLALSSQLKLHQYQCRYDYSCKEISAAQVELPKQTQGINGSDSSIMMSRVDCVAGHVQQHTLPSMHIFS